VVIADPVPQLVTKVLKQMLRGLDIGNNSLGLGAIWLRSKIESASQMIEPVATVSGSLFGKPKLLQIVA
jgi:hypothetical protein